MRRATLKTAKGEFTAIELPVDDAELLGRMDDFFWSYSSASIGWGKFQLIGKHMRVARIPDITIEELEKILPETYFKVGKDSARKYHYGIDEVGYFELYASNNPACPNENQYTECIFESFNSLFKANGIIFEDELGEEPVLESYKQIGSINTSSHISSENDMVDFKYDHDQWQKARAEAWDKTRTYLFERI